MQHRFWGVLIPAQVTGLFSRQSRLINILGGLLLIGIVLYDLARNWPMFRLFLA